MKSQNPFGLQTITPYLIAEDVANLIAFLQELLGAELRGEPHLRDNGTIAHAELKIGDSVVMMGSPMDQINTSAATLYTYVDDCDAVYAKALEIGAESVLDLATYPHGDRYGGIKDPAGNTWWLVTHVGK